MDEKRAVTGADDDKDGAPTSPTAGSAPQGTLHGPDPRILEDLEEPLEAAMGAYDLPDDDLPDGLLDGGDDDAIDGPSHEEDVRLTRPSQTDGSTEGRAAKVTSTAAGSKSKPRGPRLQVAGARHHRPVRSPKGATVSKKGTKAGGPKVKTRVGAEEDKDRARARKGALFMAAIFAVSMLWIVVSGQMDEFLHALNSVDGAWVVGGALCMVLYFTLGSVAYMLAAYIDPDSPLGVRDCMSVEASGTLFGNLTPMSSGAVPAQIFRLTQAGLDIGEASATQFTRFIIYQAGEVVVAALMLVLELRYFMEAYGDIVLINVVVFIIQTAQVLGLLAVCLMPRFVIRVGNWAVGFGSKRGWISDEKASHWLHLINTQVNEFAATFKASFKHRQSLGLTMVVTFFQLCSFYAVPWFVLNAFGRQGDFLVCLAAGSMVQMIGNSVPLPGGTGGNEAGFALFFGAMFGPAATAGFIVWRLITFYGPTALCLPLTALRSSHRRSIYQRWNGFWRRRRSRARYRFRR